jgi:hypothetical protein
VDQKHLSISCTVVLLVLLQDASSAAATQLQAQCLEQALSQQLLS